MRKENSHTMDNLKGRIKVGVGEKWDIMSLVDLTDLVIVVRSGW